MPDGRFTLHDAREILAPYLKLEEQRESAHATDAHGEVKRCAGVAWSGLGAAPPRAPRSPDEIRAAAEAALDRAARFAASPRGRFLVGLRALERLGYAGECETARAAFARGFADPDRPARPAEIGAALAVLTRLERREARTACLALTELLSSELRMAAE
ncbi:hypothetical protein LJR219_002942 [Phenylobacterium sp. LjRoot219]|uniref:hypothetical protein n=1 Tax=Phenylobacterium sp. LjRoot219 TaxID=3342283 RepID=UPI003ECD810C